MGAYAHQPPHDLSDLSVAGQQLGHRSGRRVGHVDRLRTTGRPTHESDGPSPYAQRLRQRRQRCLGGLTVDGPRADSDHERSVMRPADQRATRARPHSHQDSHPAMMPAGARFVRIG